jgi:16S rRNA (guanine527-N7)-methyltransferase
LPHSPAALDPGLIATEVRAQLETALVPLNASALAPQFLDRITKFAETLARWGARTNLTARPDDPVEIVFHIIDSLMPLLLDPTSANGSLKQAFGPAARVLDVGSGAGFPGLVLASASDARFMLVEARRKRASFLQTAMVEMGLGNVTVAQKRLAPADLNGDFDIVLTRALGPLADFYAIAVAALAKGGIAILYANPNQRLDLNAAHSARLGKETRIPYSVGRGSLSVSRTLILFQKL